MGDIRKPFIEESFLGAIAALEERPKKRYEVKAIFGSNTRLVVVESHRTAQELLQYYVALIHSGKPVYLVDIDNNDRLAYTVRLNNADSFTVATVLEDY